MIRRRATRTKDQLLSADPDDERRASAPARAGQWLLPVAATLLVLLVVVAGLVLIGTVVHRQSSTASTAACPTQVASLPRTLASAGSAIRAAAARAPAISYTQYAADPAAHAGRKVLLSNADFLYGTVRLLTSGLFVLTEDVLFEPNAHANWMPERTQSAYTNPAFRLGFFAAITVEADSIVLDLQGHRIAQSAVFAIQQRFYSHIELSNQPFINGQGPTSFGETPVRVRTVIVENGVLGRSAHHGIHGNGGSRVLVRNLHIEQYEVAAVALNGFSDSAVQSVVSAGTFTQIPILGTYFNARILSLFLERCMAMTSIPAEKRNAVQAAADRLGELRAEVLADVRSSGFIDATAHPEAYALFANQRGRPDGNSYGMLFHPFGAAVGSFWHELPTTTERLLVDNCTVANTTAHIIEVVALVADDGRPVRGPAGDILRLSDNSGRPSMISGANGAYRGNALADAQIALMAAAATLSTEEQAVFGTLHGTDKIVEWATGQTTLEQLVGSDEYHYERNGDTMFHVNKGVIGLRIDGAKQVCLRNVRIENTVNTGARGNVAALPGESSDVEASYTGHDDGGHPGQGLQYGYMGADTRGISIAASTAVFVDRVRVDGVHSEWGYARGIDIFNSAGTVQTGAGCSVNNVSSLVGHALEIATGQFANGPRVGSAIGVRISGGSAASVRGTESINVTNVYCDVIDVAFDRVIDSQQEFPYERSAKELANSYAS